MRKNVIALIAAFSAMCVGTPAFSQNQSGAIFTTSGRYPWVLKINGNNYLSLDTGWITVNGVHNKYNSNYLASVRYGDLKINNWGVFDLSNLTEPVNSAYLELYTSGVFPVVTYTLYDVDETLEELDKERSFRDPKGLSLFNDLGTGVAYGSRVYDSSDGYQFRTITLNSDALSAIQSAAGRQFAIGGTITAVVVPEPSTWSLMILGVGVVGFTMRRTSKASMSKAPA